MPLKPNRICETCGTDFYASPGHVKQGWGKYCSMKCRTSGTNGVNHPNFNHELPLRECKNCGKEFRKKPFAIERGEGVYCSRKCQSLDGRENCTCPNCGKIFSAHKSRVTNQDSIYCSQKCHRESIRPVNNCKCLTCGKAFYVKSLETKSAKRGAGSFCSIECKAKAMSKSQITASGANRNTRGGKREDLGFYVRSSWEANYARYLIWLQSLNEITSWEYEPETFEFPVKRGSKFYTPDFKITNLDGTIEYHEVKGWMDKTSATKIKRMGVHYPKLKLIVIDSDSYKAIAKNAKNLVPNWE